MNGLLYKRGEEEAERPMFVSIKRVHGPLIPRLNVLGRRQIRLVAAGHTHRGIARAVFGAKLYVMVPTVDWTYPG